MSHLEEEKVDRGQVVVPEKDYSNIDKSIFMNAEEIKESRKQIATSIKQYYENIKRNRARRENAIDPLNYDIYQHYPVDPNAEDGAACQYLFGDDADDFNEHRKFAPANRKYEDESILADRAFERDQR